jgi:hypothetical protein
MYRSRLQIQNRQNKVVVVIIIKIKMENVVHLGSILWLKMFHAGAALNRHFDRSTRKVVASSLIRSKR